MKIEDFLNNEVVHFASYSTYRAIASCIDGLKNAHRKVIYSMLNDKSNKETKLSVLSGKVMTETEYLHGDISGSIITLAQDFVGTNNIPLLTSGGIFGSRFKPEPSATRYISSNRNKITDLIFHKEDNKILIEQIFEGTKIEPRFFVPTLPLILINGSEGIATGFAQKILPRSVENIKNYIDSYINNKKLPELMPHYNGFKGTIEKGKEKNQWLIKGLVKKVSTTKVEISEVPIGYSLSSYTKVLNKLEDDKVIRKYEDLSEDDNFKFVVTLASQKIKKGNEYLLDILKLTKKVTENFTILDENNLIKEYKSPEEVINHYIKIKLEYMKKRKDNMIKELKQDIKLEVSKLNFINSIIKEELKINKVKKDVIISNLEKIKNIIKVNDSFDYLLNMSMYSMTQERVEKLIETIKNKKIQLEEIKNKSVEDMWKEDIAKII